MLNSVLINDIYIYFILHNYHINQPSSDYSRSGCKALNLFIIFNLKASACVKGLPYPPASPDVGGWLGSFSFITLGVYFVTVFFRRSIGFALFSYAKRFAILFIKYIDYLHLLRT